MKILIICSKVFYDQIPMIKNSLENMWHEIFLPNCYDKPNTESEMWKLWWDCHSAFKSRMFKQSEEVIRWVDWVLVLNFDKILDGMVFKNYIGWATFLELYDAFRFWKKIFLFNDIPVWILFDEIQWFSPIVLNWNLECIN